MVVWSCLVMVIWGVVAAIAVQSNLAVPPGGTVMFTGGPVITGGF